MSKKQVIAQPIDTTNLFIHAIPSIGQIDYCAQSNFLFDEMRLIFIQNYSLRRNWFFNGHEPSRIVDLYFFNSKNDSFYELKLLERQNYSLLLPGELIFLVFWF